MAVTRKSGGSAMTTTGETVIAAVPANTTYEIIHLQVTNIDGTNAANATVSWTDASNSDLEIFLCEGTEVAALDSISPCAGVLILEAGDTLKTVASANGDLQVSYSYVARD